jgi:hypothetical protein
MGFTTEFIVDAPGAPASGTAVYFNPVLAGKKAKVFREGYYQYESLGQNFYVNTNTGTLLFLPEFTPGERIRIQTI